MNTTRPLDHAFVGPFQGDHEKGCGYWYGPGEYHPDRKTRCGYQTADHPSEVTS